jgi:hypothetical protein
MSAMNKILAGMAMSGLLLSFISPILVFAGDDHKESHKIVICHLPPGNPENIQTIEIDEHSLDTHLGHGDYVGECGEVVTPPDTDPIVCDTGFHLVDNACIEDEEVIVVDCALGYHLVDNACVADVVVTTTSATTTETTASSTDPVTEVDDNSSSSSNTNSTSSTSIGGGGSSTGGHHHDAGSSSSSNARGQVLGASTCEPYLKSYIKLGAKNDQTEVIKLQIFLNEYMGADLTLTGIYDAETLASVNQFQMMNMETVLKPWTLAGLQTDEPTGYVYKTTKRWINILKCPESILSTPIPALP